MKTQIILFLTAILLSISGMAQKYTIEFVIKNVKNDQGVISAALFSGEKNFPEKEKALYNTSVSASEGEVKIRFENIPAGEYALAVFHDENDNKDFFEAMNYLTNNNNQIYLLLTGNRNAKFRVSGDYYSAMYLAY